MPRFRKIALAAGAVVASLLVLALVLPFLFRDRIAARLHLAIDESIDARVAWRSAGVSVLRDFPGVSLSLDGASVVGHAPFAGDTLVVVHRARVVLDLGSVVRQLTSGGKLVVREVVLDRPSAHLRVLPDGRANWDIVRERPAGARDGRRAVEVSLRHLRIDGGSLRLDDEQSRVVASVHGLEERLTGDFGDERFVLATSTKADSVSVQFAGIQYLSRASLDLVADIDADMARRRFTFARDTLRLNALQLAFDGSVTSKGEDAEVDVRFVAPGTEFREILSLVPVVYRRDFQSLRTSGKMSLSGQVRGRYGPRAFPAVAVRARVENGAFQYPALPLPARGIALSLRIDNPGGHVDSTVVAVDQLRATIGGRPISGRFVVRTPVSDPRVELALAGTLDLADLPRTVKLEGVSALAGVASANVAMRTRLSDVDARRYERVAAVGTVTLSRVGFRSADLPRAVAIDTAGLRLTPSAADLGALAVRVGTSEVRAAGSLENLLGFFLRGDDLRGRATVHSNRFDLSDWRPADVTTDAVPIPPRVDFALEVQVRRAVHGKLEASDVRGSVRVKNRRATLDELRMNVLRGTAVAGGYYETVDVARPAMDVLMRVDTVDIRTAFSTVVTVQKVAPVARWAQGRVSGTVWLRGPLDRRMVPVYDSLNGEGTFVTSELSLEGQPVLVKIGDALSLPQLRSPSVGVVRGSFQLASGRVTVKPFAVKVAGMDMTVSGSHGLDQTLRYDLGMALPRSALGSATTAAVEKLAARAGRAATTVTGNEVVKVGARVSGTVTDPVLSLDFAGVAASAREAVAGAVRQEVATRAEDVRQKADSALGEARRRARVRADSIVAAAEREAQVIRTEAREVAGRIRQEAYARADSLVARATNPAARIGAQAARERLRREADQQAERAVREADSRADALVTAARRQADALVPPG